MTKAMREENEFNCRSVTNAYNMNGGAPKCVIYLAVECQECVYKLSVDVTVAEKVVAPRYLIEKQSVTGTVAKGAVEYYYFPFIVEETMEIAVVLNKTEGDAFIVMNVIADSVDGYTKWNYPNATKAAVISREKNPNIPELITSCDNALIRTCSNATDNCILLIGVYGDNTVGNSKYNLIVHGDDSRVISERPRNATL